MLVAAAGDPVGGASATGNYGIGRNFQQRKQYEAALAHARVRQRQAVFVEVCGAVQQQVEIERSRCVAEAAFAAVAVFDVEQRGEQGARRESSFNLRDGIDEIGLVNLADRR